MAFFVGVAVAVTAGFAGRIAVKTTNRSRLFEAEIRHKKGAMMMDLSWGEPDVLFTPAYWKFQVESIACSTPHTHRLTTSLKTECIACLLGGHGIPAEVGLAAFEAISMAGLLNQHSIAEADIFRTLSIPLRLANGRQARYRFARQKSIYLAEFLNRYSEPQLTGSHHVRNWLTRFRGFGLKTASWVVRNWFDSDEVAILDIHVYRAGIIAGFFTRDMSIARDYLELERRHLAFAAAISVRPSVLDAVIWRQMRRAGRLVQQLAAC